MSGSLKAFLGLATVAPLHPREAGATMLSKESSAIDFVRDAFAHLKAT